MSAFHLMPGGIKYILFVSDCSKTNAFHVSYTLPHISISFTRYYLYTVYMYLITFCFYLLVYFIA
jgi:hypothetical protein